MSLMRGKWLFSHGHSLARFQRAVQQASPNFLLFRLRLTYTSWEKRTPVVIPVSQTVWGWRRMSIWKLRFQLFPLSVTASHIPSFLWIRIPGSALHTSARAPRAKRCYHLRRLGLLEEILCLLKPGAPADKSYCPDPWVP